MNKKSNLLLIALLPFSLFGIFSLFLLSSDTDNSAEEHKKTIQANYNIYSLSPPKQMSFAGEKVPLDKTEVYERLDREIHSNTYFHSNTILYFKKANRWFPTIEPILEKNGIPDDFKYLALIESGLTNVVSPAGATGFWQFLKSTGKEYGLEIREGIDERYHLEKSSEAACKYLNDAFEKYGSWSLVAASYNTGMNRVSKELERQKADSYYDLLLSEETSRYVFRILAIKQIFSEPEAYGFHIRKSDLYKPLDYNTIEIDTSVNDFAAFAKEHNVSYKILKYFNPWLRDSYLNNPQQKVYTLKIPSHPNYQLN